MKNFLRISITFFLSILLAVGCVKKQPVYYDLICPLEGEQGKAICNAQERIDFFNQFVREAIHQAGSVFTIYGISSSRYSLIMKLCVPAGSLGIKQKWLEQARNQLAGQVPIVQVCTSAQSDGKNLVKIAGQILLDEDALNFSAKDGLPLHTFLLCDLSNSTLELGCQKDLVKKFAGRWLKQSQFIPGSTFEIYTIGFSRDSTQQIYQAKITHKSPGERAADLMVQLGQLPDFAATFSNASSILEAISVVNRAIQDQNGQAELFIISDMRQVTSNRWNFESQIPRQEDFMEWARQQNLIQPLAVSSVAICGVHQLRGPGSPEFTALMDSGLEDLWKAVFKEMNANPRFLRDCSLLTE